MQLLLAAVMLAAVASAQKFPEPPCYIYGDDKIEAPCMIEVANKTDYGVRVYGASAESEYWSTARVEGSYSDAEDKGFQANFAYISGANDKKQHIPMTHPVLQRVNASNPDSWEVSFFVPSAFSKSSDSVPKPTGADVYIEKAPLIKIAYKEFPGFATQEDFDNCFKALTASLARDGVKLSTGNDWSAVWAQYDSPFTLFNRHNECWLRVE